MRKSILVLTMCALLLGSGFAFAEGELLNVNTATEAELAAVPGMNADLAKAIVSYRNDMGDIQSLDELLEVGVSKDLLEKLKSHIGLDALSGAECAC